jgi:hypothetical protein
MKTLLIAAALIVAIAAPAAAQNFENPFVTNCSACK